MSFGSLPSVLGNGGGVAISVIGGRGLFADGTAAAPSISFSADPDTGFYRGGSNIVIFSAGGAASLSLNAGGSLGGQSGQSLTMPTGGAITLAAAGTNQNITLTPSGTGVVQIGDGTSTGQLTLRTSVANTGTAALSLFSTGNVDLQIRNSSSNLSFFRDTTEFARFNTSNRFLLGTTTDSGALLQIGTNTTANTGGIAFGTDAFLYRTGSGELSLDHIGGSLPSLKLLQNGTVRLYMYSAGANGVLGSLSGSLTFLSNNTTALTLDSSQNATFAGYVSSASYVIAAATSAIGLSGRSKFKSPSDGVMTVLNGAESDFSRLQFGGTTSSFPALKRNGTRMDVVLGDASDDAVIRAKAFLAAQAATTAGASEISYGSSTAATVGATGAASALPALPLGYIIVNVAGTAAKIPYYNS